MTKYIYCTLIYDKNQNICTLIRFNTTLIEFYFKSYGSSFFIQIYIEHLSNKNSLICKKLKKINIYSHTKWWEFLVLNFFPVLKNSVELLLDCFGKNNKSWDERVEKNDHHWDILWFFSFFIKFTSF